MKRRVGWSLLLMAALLIVAAPVALAYGSANGQVNDASGNPWTHGGTVTCSTDTGTTVGSGTIAANGSWSVTFALRGAAVCVVDPAAAPSGNPISFTCDIPRGGGAGAYDCGTRTLNAGPNAVTLVSFAGRSINPAWLLAPLGLVAGLLAWKRHR